MLFSSPKNIKNRVEKIWLKGDLHRANLEKSNIFPLQIALPTISAKALLTEFSKLQAAISTLREDSRKHGYLINDKIINHRQLGEQKIPVAIEFENESVLLRYLGKTQEFDTFNSLATQTLAQYPSLLTWLLRYPFKLIKFSLVWQSLLRVCAYFEANPKPDCYIRQLDIATVDTKFIEQHKGILTELLDIILPLSARNTAVSGLSNHGFERRYGLRYDLPLIRLRILDKALAIQNLSDLTVTQQEFKALNLAAKTVFIAENKINGLAFPDVPDAIVIFGLGYAVDLLKDACCLQSAKLYYWGDLDTHGFAILSRLRGYYPQVQSLLMDEKTLQKFELMRVTEPENTAELGELANLTELENKLFKFLQKHLIRLEQERISYTYLLQQLDSLKNTKIFDLYD
ncbi:MAG: hypothetical protein GQ569_00395 [Methylococcaceae bacterium]|nr:hypothetical protein [Methylococcaceae bacterium]